MEFILFGWSELFIFVTSMNNENIFHDKIHEI